MAYLAHPEDTETKPSPTNKENPNGKKRGPTQQDGGGGRDSTLHRYTAQLAKSHSQKPQ